MLKLLVWFLIASVLLVVGYVFLIGGSAMGMVAPSLDWKRWPAIRRARKIIREVARQRCSNAKVFSHQGATKIDPRYLNFLITTDTDGERDLMRNDSQIYEQFCNALLNAGYPQQAIPSVHFSIESQEKVDRDYGGRWNEAIQMP
jgi:hypothetical protein